MVQYILTPWRDRQELLLVRQQFYPDAGLSRLNEDSSRFGGHRLNQQHHHQVDDDHQGHQGLAARTEAQRQEQHKAVARVSMWVQRGNCPHMAESTALLMAALLSDEEQMCNTTTIEAGRARSSNDDTMASSAYAIRAAYSTAFSRFVTGLLDGQQDKQRKQSMYSLAKTVGLPATFVELRHQSTHEQLPSLAQLRSAAKKALLWIWDYYWKNLSASSGDEADDMVALGGALTCDEAVTRYIRVDDEDGTRLAELKSRWDGEQLLASITRVKQTVLGNQAYLKCVSLAQQVQDEQNRHGGEEGEKETGVGDEAALRQGESVTVHPGSGLKAGESSTSGWSVYPGSWTAKPIGIV